MRKILILTMAFLLPFFALEMRADEEVQIKKIPLWVEDGTMLRRDLIIPPIESYYNGAMCAISSSTVEDLGEVELIVTNLSTGESWWDTFDSSSEPQSASRSPVPLATTKSSTSPNTVTSMLVNF